MEDHKPASRLDRRSAIKWILTASATIPFLNTRSLGQSGPATATEGGIGFDPNLMGTDVPWDLMLTDEQLKTVTALCDTILPRVGESPSANELKVPDFIDEWISAPYPDSLADRDTILPGLGWLDGESNKRFSQSFDQLSEQQKKAICDDIAYLPDAKPEFQDGARFFAKFRDLTLGGYYTTDLGTREVGYVGNVALASFDGPPPDVMKFLGIDKAPW